MPDTLVILTPAFGAHEGENWLPSQSAFIRMLNKQYPQLELIILTFRFPVAPGRRYSWHGNQVVAFGGGRQGKVHSLLLWRRVWQELKRLRRRHKLVGIFSFFCVECAFVGHYFAKRYGLKHHIWVLGQDARTTNKQVARIRPQPEELVAISDFLVREFERSHGIRPAHLIPIGINPDFFPPPAAQRDIDIIGVGSLSPIKQYDVFIEVVASMARDMPGIKALICGDGSEHESLQQLIRGKNLGANLSLAGEKSHTGALSLMRQSKILLHTSAYEGYGMVCAEALYAGAHVISFCQPMDVPIAHWHIVGSPEEMKAKALALLRDEGTEYSSVLTYPMEETVRRIMQLYGYSAGTES
jgi:glycosyltransferase involved in cell wall biosynthesis